MFTIGIDLGANGGICLLKDKEILLKTVMPKHVVDGDTDWYEIDKIFATILTYTRRHKTRVLVEKIHMMPGNAAKSSTTFNRHIGRMNQMIFSWFHKEPEEISPRKWQKWIFEHTNTEEMKNAKGKRATKDMALKACTTLFGGEDFRRNSRCKVSHDGMIDAALIAYYGAHNV